MASTASTRQISVAYLNTLGKVKVDSRQSILYDVSLTVGPLTILAVSASFGWLPSTGSNAICSSSSGSSAGGEVYERTAQMLSAQPVFCESALENTTQCAGSVLLAKRGVVSFAEKARRAQEAGAAALIVSQSYDIWPFIMTPEEGQTSSKVAISSSSASTCEESNSAESISSIPVVMISKRDAEIIAKMLTSGTAPPGRAAVPTVVTLKIGERATECSICQEGFAEGEEVLKLACRHLYHAHCVTEWLHAHNTCPLCRLQLPHRQAGEAPSRRPAASSNSVTSTYYN